MSKKLRGDRMEDALAVTSVETRVSEYMSGIPLSNYAWFTFTFLVWRKCFNKVALIFNGCCNITHLFTTSSIGMEWCENTLFIYSTPLIWLMRVSFQCNRSDKTVLMKRVQRYFNNKIIWTCPRIQVSRQTLCWRLGLMPSLTERAIGPW